MAEISCSTVPGKIDERLTEVTIQRALAHRALMDAERKARESHARTEILLDIMQAANKVTVTPRSGCNLIVYRVSRMSGNRGVFGEIESGQEFVGTGFEPTEDGIALTKVVANGLAELQVILSADEGGEPDFVVTGMEIDVPVEQAAEALMEFMRSQPSSSHRIDREFYQFGFPGSGRFSQYIIDKALRWLIATGELAQDSDGLVILADKTEVEKIEH